LKERKGAGTAHVRDDGPRHANVLGIEVEALNMARAVERVAEVLESNEKGYVSVIGVHGVMEAQRNPQLAAIYAHSAITIPDGMPTVWVGRLQGCAEMERVTGPDLMLEVFRNPKFGHCTHFFYGGEEGVAKSLAQRLTRKFPGAQVVGTYTPPWRELSDEEGDELVARIRKLKPDFFWVGISAPRQEVFMNRYLPVLETKLMFGVGAAFDYHTGRIQDSPQWVKRAGLQWLHRLLQDPRRLWRRYLRNNPAFVWHILLQLSGLRRYDPGRVGVREKTAAAAPAPRKPRMVGKTEFDG
jgi:N-acetylglucosaminyldiphosphoundecaprenol N-acetyl-beta-D-mannosaminyltransferase